MKKTLFGGNRLGSGNKISFDTKTFNRSTHNLSETFRSTMSSGTLVPFLVLPTVPGDTIDIDLDCDIRTLPTIGPLFGSYKVQLDVYQIPLRLYMRDLQMNKLEIGRDMSKVKFPLMTVAANDIGVGLNYENTKETPWGGKEINNCQIEPSSILSYLGIKGLGYSSTQADIVHRRFNAIPWLMYWDIFKQYYANKMEDNAYVIHNPLSTQADLVQKVTIIANSTAHETTMDTDKPVIIKKNMTIILTFGSIQHYNQFLEDELEANFTYDTGNPKKVTFSIRNSNLTAERNPSQLKIYYTAQIPWANDDIIEGWNGTINVTSAVEFDFIKPNLHSFPLKNIDEMREIIMTQDGTNPLVLDYTTPIEPYSTIFQTQQRDVGQPYAISALQCKQEGLAIKTYQSDVNNNWLNTEWIDGENGVNDVTAIQVDENGKFTLDEFNIKKKVYDLAYHIVASGGSYDDWQDTIWGIQRMKQISSPVYEGGMSKELEFQEVISNSASEVNGEQPLGTLAGRGVVHGGQKGGKLVIKTSEPSYIIGIVSLTPRIDYSQGNEWHTNLENMGELHNPYLDGIAYQDLITDTIAFWDTALTSQAGLKTYKSAGKQPSWINYQTSKNKVYGNFALQNEQMFMVLNRRYDIYYDTSTKHYGIDDLTTYIDPSKYNHIFADVSPDAMNFWVQIGMKITARRVMSANQIPNL